MTLTSRYRFAAAHRLDTPALTPQQNRELYGKCNNPWGHGHDYVLDLTIAGPLDESGQLVNRQQLDDLVRSAVLSRLDHKNLNVDIPEFADAVATTENLAMVIRNYLQHAWTLAPRLVKLRISETDRNSFVWEAK
ncbi:MAG: 6-carboxytetrahydropterin synthase [Acidobacteriota bacterium]